MFRDLEGGFTAKLSDFGHAAISSEKDHVRLPRIQPFNAPEHHHRPVSIKSAISQDVFAFGMTCLYILFHDRLLVSSISNTNDTVERSQLILKQFNFLQNKNQTCTIVQLALAKVAEDVTIGLDLKARLNEFFTSALEKDPNRRLLNREVLHKVFNREL
jgi:serine/threonine protein kinase